jgi:hypothetical protein
MKTLYLSISIVVFLLIFGNMINSYALNFESTKLKYYPLVHVSELDPVITNSSMFKEKIQGYHYNLITTVSKLNYLQNGSYGLEPTDVVYFLYVSDISQTNKTLVVTIDQKHQILGMAEFSPWNVPLGYPWPLIHTSLYVPQNYTALKIDVNKLVTIMPPSPLKQVKHGVAANDVDCFHGMEQLELIFKSEDKSPACVNYGSIGYLTQRGWVMNQTATETINLVDDNVNEVSIGKNGTASAMKMITMHIQNFQTFSQPVIIKIFYTNGTLYKTEQISSNDIQPNGYYKYNLIISSPDSSIFSMHKVDVEHHGNVGEILIKISPPP